ARLKTIMKEITSSENVIIFIDELHTLVGAGAAEGSIDASNMLKPALSRGELQCIGATTLDEYRRYIEKQGALERRFQPIIVNPPTTEETIEIIRGLKDKYESHHQARITDESIIAAVRLSDRYVSDRYLPDKAIDVVDEASSRVRLQRVTLPPELRALQRQIEEVAREKREHIERQEFERAVELRDLEEELQKKVDELKGEWEETREQSEPVVTDEDITYVISRMTGIPLSKMEEAESVRLLKMADELHRRVVGQDEAIAAITRSVRRSRAGLKEATRPIGSFLFLGPTGVGKTELARSLAEFLFGDEAALVSLDMSEYMERFSASRLTGAPPGYVGYEEGGQLTERVRRRPYSVVLLDEIEKAHPDIFHMLLQIMDEGRLTDSYGRLVDFKNVVLIMTSNMSARTVSKGVSLGFQKEDDLTSYERMKENLLNEVRRTFNPEFLNRLDEVLVFHALTREDIKEIVGLMLDRLNAQLIERGLTLELDEEVKEYIAQEGYDPAFGARPLKRTIQRLVEDPLSEEVLKGRFQGGGVIVVRREGDQLVFIDKREVVESVSDA
ncbi:MAG: ATP-dependent Clp protease ATP-binding subunit, partial [Candidatus Tectimicrobiota bacterium]